MLNAQVRHERQVRVDVGALIQPSSELLTEVRRGSTHSHMPMHTSKPLIYPHQTWTAPILLLISSSAQLHSPYILSTEYALYTTFNIAMELLELCYDVLIQILEEVEPEDLAALAQTSWAFNRLIKENTLLYKTHFLKNFVSPRCHGCSRR